MIKKIFLLLLSISIGLISLAQTKEEEKYRQQSENLRKEVWAWVQPQFKVRDIPTQFAGASKVVIAHHTELAADSKSKFAFYGLGFSIRKDMTIMETVREVIKLNDKKAVEEYSEFSFTQFRSASGFSYNAKSTTFVGIRVVKPDGSIKEVNADEIVLTKDSKKEKRAKVAIPDLQVGDVIDYFVATQETMSDDYSEKPYQIILFDEAPVLNYTFHAQFGKKYSVEYRSYNGAPDLVKLPSNEDEDILFSLDKKNIPAFETSLWVSAERQLPFIRLNLAMGSRSAGGKSKRLNEPGAIYKNRNFEDILTEKEELVFNEYISVGTYYYAMLNGLLNKVQGDNRKEGKKFGDLTEAEQITKLYYALRYWLFIPPNSTLTLKEYSEIGESEYNGLSMLFISLLRIAEIDVNFVLITPKNGYRLKEISRAADLKVMAFAPTINKFLVIENPYSVAFVEPSEIEGVDDARYCRIDLPRVVFSTPTFSNRVKIAPTYKVPLQKSTDHMHIDKLNISLMADKPALKFQKTTTLRGDYKAALQKQLILFDDYFNFIAAQQKDNTTLYKEVKNRRTVKSADEFQIMMDEKRSHLVDQFKEEAADWFEQEITDVTNFGVDSMGVHHQQPNFVFHSTFQVDGMVKKAGKNYIIEIGKIQGNPLTIKPEQRKRDLDIYMTGPRSIEYDVALDIPDGYIVKGIAALNKNVENETGYFKVEATATDKQVIIKVKKHYLHYYEPASNWDKMLAFIDAASDWSNAKILFKKK